MDYIVTAADELSEGDRMVIEIEGKEIGIFQKDGEYHAHLNWCPHQGGPVCEGQVTGRQRACYDQDTLELETEWADRGKILNCPWHGWEFDVTTGECLSRDKIKLPTFPVTVDDGNIVVSV